MNDRRVNERGVQTLDDVLTEALADARSRGPGRFPRCPVCGQPMAVVDAGEDASPVLRCDGCGARLEDAPADGPTLRLVA
jgi:hypothetical protein